MPERRRRRKAPEPEQPKPTRKRPRKPASDAKQDKKKKDPRPKTLAPYTLGKPRKLPGPTVAYRSEAFTKAITHAKKQAGNVKSMRELGTDGINDTCLSTGSLVMNLLLFGGLGAGSMTTIAAGSGAGKSTLCHSTVGCAQRSGMVVLIHDTEHALDIRYGSRFDWSLKYKLGKKFGVEMFRLFSLDQVWKHIYSFLCDWDTRAASSDYGPRRPGDAIPGLIVVDSLRIDSDASVSEEQNAGLADAARVNAAWLGKIVNKLRSTGFVLLASNHLTNKIGAMGDPRQEPGGTAVQYRPDNRVWGTKASTAKFIPTSYDNPTQMLNFRLIKTRGAMPETRLGTMIEPGVGLMSGYDTYAFLNSLGLVLETKSRSTLYSVDGLMTNRTRGPMLEYLGHPDLRRTLDIEITDRARKWTWLRHFGAVEGWAVDPSDDADPMFIYRDETEAIGEILHAIAALTVLKPAEPDPETEPGDTEGEPDADPVEAVAEMIAGTEPESPAGDEEEGA